MNCSAKYYILAVILFLIIGIQKVSAQNAVTLQADTEIIASVQDTVVLRLDQYVGEHVQWQSSNNMSIWLDIPEANADTLLFASDTQTSIYFRAKVIAGCCDPFFSSTILVEVFNLAQIETLSVEPITAISASSGGQVNSDGGTPIIGKGVVWSTEQNPTVEANHGVSDDGVGSDSWVSNLSELTPSTNYYVRAYATTIVGTSYGQQLDFITLDGIASVITVPVTDITSITAKSGGEITTNGGAPITARGVVWGNTENPTIEINNGLTDNGTGIGTWISELTDLEPGTNYYLRAYATNVVGTEYGEEQTFTTEITYPQVVTAEITDITQYTALCGGEVTCDGGTSIIAQGVVWSTNQEPTLDSNGGFTEDTNDAGVFISSITNLESNTTYYLRAYATNSVGTTYGEEKSFSTLPLAPVANFSADLTTGEKPLTVQFTDISENQPIEWDWDFGDGNTSTEQNPEHTYASEGEYSVSLTATNTGGSHTETKNDYIIVTFTPELPQVTTSTLTNITTNTASGGGEVTDDGGGNITARGVVWSTSENPTLEEKEGYTENGEGVGEFISELTGLEPNTMYYVRAYATNGTGNAYGEQQTFTSYAVMDIDGNGYYSVVIGVQEWITENLKVTHFRNGDQIPSSLDDTQWSETTDGAYAIYPYEEIDGLNSDVEVVEAYGILYNWYAVDDVRGLCPTGWHVPTDAEWYTMENYVDPTINDPNATGWRGVDGGTKLKSTSGWYSDGNGTDVYGLCTLPGGARNSNGAFYNESNIGSWWSGTEDDAASAWDRGMRDDLEEVYRINASKGLGFSIRCIKDEQLPTVNTTVISDIGATTATGGGNITDNGGSTVSNRGVVWSKTENPTIETNEGSTTDGSGTGSFTSELTGLEPNTMYYFRAYATNSTGNAYGEQQTFTSYAVMDIDGNGYYSVVIGVQEWITENLRTTRYQDGTEIPNVINGNDWQDLTSGAYCWYDNDISNKNIYGALYNWYAVDDERGLCPIGWYVPSDEDWTNLIDFLIIEEGLTNIQDDVNAIGNNLKSCRQQNSPLQGDCNTSDHPRWDSDETHFGIDSYNFSAFPGGANRGGNEPFYRNIGYRGNWWSSTEYSYPHSAWYRVIESNDGSVKRHSVGKNYGLSVRCVKDEQLPTVNTTVISDIGATTATGGGNITDDGGATVIARGVCWSTNQEPTLVDNHTTDGTGTGTFESSITDLLPNTTYYVRAYATNNVGTAYGEEKSFTTATTATIVTADITNILTTTATSGGNVTASGGVAVTSRGVVWSTSESPTVETNEGITTDETGTGSFTSELNELTKGTTYYVKAYATNEAGTAYGEQQTFTSYAVMDIDGNGYYSILIGEQEWMAENLKVTHYNNGSPIQTGLDNTQWSETTDGAYAVHPHTLIEGLNSDAEVLEAYGALYNWYGVETGNLCPTGWRVPTDTEWTILIDYVVAQGYPNSDIVDGAGNALKSCRQINSPLEGECSTSLHPRWNSESNGIYGIDIFGFSALPSSRRSNSGSFSNVGYHSHSWSSTEDPSLSETHSFARTFYHYKGLINRGSIIKKYGYSVRCIKAQ